MRFRERLIQKNNDYHSYPGIHIAFLGDSVTHGVFEAFRGSNGRSEIIVDTEAVYHTKLKQKLNMVVPSVPVNILNAGISGDSALGGHARLDRDVISHKPDLAVVCFGLNDSGRGLTGLEDYRNALQEIFHRLTKAEIEIVFMTPNMMNTYVCPLIQDPFFQKVSMETAETQNSGIMDAYMDAARKICKDESIPVCDVYAKWKVMYKAGVDVTMLLANYINHPTRDMHALFADALFELIMFGDVGTVSP